MSLSSVLFLLLSFWVYIGLRMSRSSGNKTLDMSRIYIPASGARSSGAGGGLGGRHPRRLAPRRRLPLFWVSELPKSQGCVSGRYKRRLLVFKFCEVIFLKKDKKDVVLLDVYLIIVLSLGLLFWSLLLAWVLIGFDVVLADEQVPAVRAGTESVIGVKRSYDLGDEGSFVEITYKLRSSIPDMVKYGDKQKWRFSESDIKRNYIETAVTFIAVSKKSIEYRPNSGTKDMLFVDGKPLKLNTKIPWSEFVGEDGIYFLGTSFGDAKRLKDLSWANEFNRKSYPNTLVGITAYQSSVVGDNDNMGPGKDKWRDYMRLDYEFSSSGWMPRGVSGLPQQSSDTRPKDGATDAYKYFSGGENGVVSKNVKVLENGVLVDAEKSNLAKQKGLIGKNADFSREDVKDNAVNRPVNDKLTATEEENKKRAEKEKADKDKAWWQKLLDWLIYDEDFVKEQFNSVLAGVGAPEGTRLFEVQNGRGGVLYEWALNQSDGAGVNFSTTVYGDHEVLRQIGGWGTNADWQSISKNFSKFIFTLTANYFLIKKFYKRLK